jgi:hypothetical protein
MPLQPFRTNIKQLVGALTTYFYRRGGGEHGLYAYHPVTEPLTNADFNGHSFSDVSTHTKIENTSWSTTVPTGAVALSVQILVRDNDSTASAWLRLYSTSTASTEALTCYANANTNDGLCSNAGIVPCTNGDVWYRCDASGAGTLDAWLRVTGYWL